MVDEFTDINRGMEKMGTFTMERKKLFQLVGKANSNLADVILKLGLFERYCCLLKYVCACFTVLGCVFGLVGRVLTPILHVGMGKMESSDYCQGIEYIYIGMG
jgi:hypothetical protein